MRKKILNFIQSMEVFLRSMIDFCLLSILIFFLGTGASWTALIPATLALAVWLSLAFPGTHGLYSLLSRATPRTPQATILKKDDPSDAFALAAQAQHGTCSPCETPTASTKKASRQRLAPQLDPNTDQSGSDPAWAQIEHSALPAPHSLTDEDSLSPPTHLDAPSDDHHAESSSEEIDHPAYWSDKTPPMSAGDEEQPVSAMSIDTETEEPAFEESIFYTVSSRTASPQVSPIASSAPDPEEHNLPLYEDVPSCQIF